MSNGKYLDAVRELEHDVIREVVDRESPRGSRHERNPSTSGGKSFDQLESSFNFGDGPVANFSVPFAVPRSRFAKILTSWPLN